MARRKGEVKSSIRNRNCEAEVNPKQERCPRCGWLVKPGSPQAKQRASDSKWEHNDCVPSPFYASEVLAERIRVNLAAGSAALTAPGGAVSISAR